MASPMIVSLERLNDAASPAPWFVRELNDEACMSAVAISTVPDDDAAWGEWPEEEMVAACLVQAPAYVMPTDQRWHENAELIVALRNNVTELLRLAKLGLAAEQR